MKKTLVCVNRVIQCKDRDNAHSTIIKGARSNGVTKEEEASTQECPIFTFI